MTYKIIAYPNGRRAVVAVLPSRGVCGSADASYEGVVERARVHARLRGEYVDIEVDGRCTAVCDGAGVVTGYEEDFRYR